LQLFNFSKSAKEKTKSWMKSIITCTLLIMSFSLKAQLIFEQGMIKGGVTGAGFSTGATVMGTGEFDIYIEPGSTIKKAWLFCMQLGNATNSYFTLNSKNYSTQDFDNIHHFGFDYRHKECQKVAIYSKDITIDINPMITKYKASIPAQLENNFSCEAFGAIYLFILYENNLMTETNYSIIFNDQSLLGNESYVINTLNPVNTNLPTGLAIYTDRVGSKQYESSIIYINDFQQIGWVYGHDSNSWNFSWAGVKGHFYYQNNQLYGLDDDVPNNTMEGGDGLADISSYLTINTTSLKFALKHINYPNQSPTRTNLNLAYFLTYTSPCTDFNATADGKCFGDSIQLSATGGRAYEWLPKEGLSCYDCPNPLFTGRQTTNYTCRIWSTDSCSKVLPVRVNIPSADSVAIKPGICGNDDGSVHFTHIGDNKGPYTYTFSGETNNTGVFSNLITGRHPYAITNSLGCTFRDTLHVKGEIPSRAIYSQQKDQNIPLKYHFQNRSENATHVIWVLPSGDTIYSENFSHLFDTGGYYNVMLIAYNKYPFCADTSYFRLFVEHELNILAPNVFTPNGDGMNELFSLQVKGAKEYSVSILNRWGKELYNWQSSQDNGWDGQDAVQGVYYWVISGTTLKGERFSKSGSFHLLR
jgi:gliding motility-associated-like protein